MANLFILKTVHDNGEYNVCLGESYSKIHLTGIKDISDNCATHEIIRDCAEYINETDHPFDTLDFIVSGDGNVYDLSRSPWGFETGVKCYYITLGGNTVDKIIPKKYKKEELDEVWKELIDDPDLNWDWDE
jgi:hypothetical protein